MFGWYENMENEEDNEKCKLVGNRIIMLGSSISIFFSADKDKHSWEHTLLRPQVHVHYL